MEWLPIEKNRPALKSESFAPKNSAKPRTYRANVATRTADGAAAACRATKARMRPRSGTPN